MKQSNRDNLNQDEILNWSREFHNKYSHNSSFTFGMKRNDRIGEKNKFICRFCGKDKNETKFKKTAHVAPKLIGNKLITSYFECDTCNSIFSKYETDLANYLGLMRYFQSPDKNGNLKRLIYKSEDEDSIVYTSKRGVEISDLKRNIFDVIEDGRIYKSKIKKKPYIPLNIYKSLVKIIVSILSEEALTHFKGITKFLISDVLDENKYAKLYSTVPKVFFNDLFVKFPIAHTYRKRKEVKKYEIENNILMPDKTFIIFFSNYLFQIYLPFDITDNLEGNNNCKIMLQLFPPLIPSYKENKTLIPSSYSHSINNFASKIKIKDDKDEFYIIAKSGSYLLKYSEAVYEEQRKKYNLIHKKKYNYEKQ